MNEPARHAQHVAPRPGPARATTSQRTHAHADRSLPCDTDAARATSLRYALKSEASGWTALAFASACDVSEKLVERWLRDGTFPTRVLSALSVAERAAYFAALDGAQIGRAA